MGTWAAFDVIESALYRACKEGNNLADGILSANEVLGMITSSQVPTPTGRIIFDGYGVNSAFASIVVQALPSSPTAEVVAPSVQQTATFVYPMPTWDERHYKWHLIRGTPELTAIAVASVCSLILLTIMITVFIHRKGEDIALLLSYNYSTNLYVVPIVDVQIRMFHYLHIVSLCFAAMIICWGLALMWQADVTLTQCNGYPWMLYLPASYLVNLINVKAHRLSTFLRVRDGKRPKPFSHGKVMQYTLLLTLFTVLILFLAMFIDPPTLVRQQDDVYRPSLDRYHCKLGNAAVGLLYLLVLGHVILSLICVVSVRNGMEAFKDGMIIKESFVILYAFLLVAVILSSLGLTAPTAYMLRTAVLSFGVTLFCLRLLINRCSRYWVPDVLSTRLLQLHKFLVQPVAEYLNPDSSSAYTSHANQSENVLKLVRGSVQLDNDADGPLYTSDQPATNCLNEMISVLSDPIRGKLFNAIGKKALCMESMEFVTGVIKYRKEAEDLLMVHSGHASNRLRETAKQLVQRHVAQNSEEEVNVSSKARSAVEKHLNSWIQDTPFLSTERASEALKEDYFHRADIFDPAFKEVCTMLYQNLWNKFRNAELQQIAGGGGMGSEVYDSSSIHV